MPLILNEASEQNYLKHGSIDNEGIELKAIAVESSKRQKSQQTKLDF
jgi:hypothetical protein